MGLGIQRRGGGGIGSGAARYGGGEYLPEGKQPGAVIGAPWSPLLPIILSGEYIILPLPVIGFHRFAFTPHARARAPRALGLKPAAAPDKTIAPTPTAAHQLSYEDSLHL